MGPVAHSLVLLLVVLHTTGGREHSGATDA